VKILVTGAAGYIGSHVSKLLQEQNHELIALDSLIRGDREKLDRSIEFYEGSITDVAFVDSIVSRTKPDAIINIAGLKSVVESLIIPKEYFSVNHEGSENLLNAAEANGVGYFVQSSTAAVYGGSQNSIVSESDEAKAISPYGESKIFAEKAVSRSIARGNIRATSLRYFNVVGSLSPQYVEKTGENLVPIVIKGIHENKPPMIFGITYPTPDGSCIRDYVHVVDLANAHIAALEALKHNQISEAINIGTGKGYSVREVISEIVTQMKSSLEPKESQPRTGDPAILVANIERAKIELGFEAKLGLEDMISSSIW
jgi:UDP-glucose 4-epimerase